MPFHPTVRRLSNTDARLGDVPIDIEPDVAKTVIEEP
jgi:hypothetical protein